MDIEQIKHILMEHAEHLMRLADRLSNSSKADPLKPHERKLIRGALMPMFSENIDMLELFFMKNRDEDFDHTLERIGKMMDWV